MQAIQTKYLPCTNSKGSRIKATCAAGSVTVNWNYSSDTKLNHVTAALTLCNKLEWSGDLVTGQLKDGSYVHVFK